MLDVFGTSKNSILFNYLSSAIHFMCYVVHRYLDKEPQLAERGNFGWYT